MLRYKLCLIVITSFFILLNSGPSEASNVFHRVKPHRRELVDSWPIIRMKSSRSVSPHRAVALFLHEFENPEEENPAEEPSAESSEEKSHPAEDTEAFKRANETLTRAAEASMDREIQSLARTADTLANILEEREHQHKVRVERQAAIDAAKQAEEAAKENAVEKSIDEQTEAQDIADKIEMEEKEKEMESKEMSENQITEAKLARSSELKEDKEIIRESKEKAEAAVAEKNAEELEEHFEDEAQRVLKEQEKMEAEASGAVEAEGIMNERTSEKKLLSDEKAEAEAIVTGEKAGDAAQRELEHRKKLQAKQSSIAEQEKLKEEAERAASPIHSRCFESMFSERCRRSKKSITAHNARGFLKNLQRAGNPAIKQEEAEAAAPKDRPKDEDNMEPKAIVGEPIEEKVETEGEHKEEEKHGEAKTSLSPTQWVYLAVIFPAGVTLAALSLVLFV